MTEKWLERELSGHLGSVSAPDILWGRIEFNLESRRKPSAAPARLAWAAIAAAVLTVTAGALWFSNGAGSGLRMESRRATPVVREAADVKIDRAESRSCLRCHA